MPSSSPVYDLDYHRKIELEESPMAQRLAEWIRQVLVREHYLTVVSTSLGLVESVDRDRAPFRATDFGCSTGIYVRALRSFAVEAIGIENSPQAVEHRVCDHVQLGDITNGCYGIWFSDLSLCIEVAEHIEEGKSDDLLRTILRHTKRWLIFSAAIPGQGGIGHVNCQEKDWWIEKFEKRGWVVDYVKTREMLGVIAQGSHMGWFTQNAMVLRPIRRS